MQPQRIDSAAITSYPVELRRIKDHLRIDHDEADDLIMNQYVPSAFEWAEAQTLRALVSRTHTLTLPRFPYDSWRQTIALPLGYCTAVESIVIQQNGSPVTLSGPTSTVPGTDWLEELASVQGAVLMPNQGSSWPSYDTDVPSPVVITFTAGYTDLPLKIELAVMFYVGGLYDGPTPLDHTNMDVASMLISEYRLGRSMV